MAKSKPSEPGADEIRLAEFRLEMGWTAWAANKWLERGMPIVRAPRFRGDDHIISRKGVFRWLFLRLDEMLTAPKAVDVDADGRPIVFEVERARLTKEQADKAAFENEESRKRLVDRLRLEAGLAAQDLALKDRLLTVPMAAAPEAVDAAREGGLSAAADVIAKHITSALADVASAEVVARVAA